MTKRMWAAADGKLAIEGKRGSFDIASVSYTHLDVYKRQDIGFDFLGIVCPE